MEGGQLLSNEPGKIRGGNLLTLAIMRLLRIGFRIGRLAGFTKLNRHNRVPKWSVLYGFAKSQ